MRAASFILTPIITALIIQGPSTPVGPEATVVGNNNDSSSSNTVTSAPAIKRERTVDMVEVFAASTPAGRVGLLDGTLVDEAADNLFHIQLDRRPRAGEGVWLEYELRGLAAHDAVPRSINHERSVGHGPAFAGRTWTDQRERLAAEEVRVGRNSIWFHAPTGAVPGYEVRNVRLVIGPTSDEHDVVITNAQLVNRGGSVHVKGVLVGQATSAAKVSAGEEEFGLHHGSFEGVAHLDPDARELAITVQRSDGTTLLRRFPLATDRVDMPAQVIPAPLSVVEEVVAENGQALDVGGASLSIPPMALDRDTRISAIALPAEELPPTGQDLINVGHQGRGFRFLPDGISFALPVGLALPYDTTRLPAGYGPEDVRTFYYNEDERRWIAIPKDSLQPQDGRIRSRTTHFTDYIAGIIQVPESPETMGYTPTSIKDYKAGDVSAGITPIAPPQASNTGAVTTRFPLKLPQGRQGMQPELAIQYNSEGGNGWMGLGWNLSTPSITIDTRWGVPRYDPGKETETYLLDGEMMSPVAHRTDWVARNTSGDKTFHTRVEGSFRRIKRKGNAPEDYWWEVTEKDGTVRYYGGDQDGVSNNAVQRIGDGNSAIAKWMLRRVVDSNGNTITYTYETEEHVGTQGSPNMGRQIYPKRIRYTGRDGGPDGPYSVEFNFEDTSRADKQINCRLGFKEVTANRLDSIAVKYNGDRIRTYRMYYSEGAFKKTLLDSIVEYDANGERFYGHGMGYYDDVRQGSQYHPYEEDASWNTPNLQNDDLGYNGWNPNVPNADMRVSLLGGSLTSNYSFGGSVTVGPAGNPFLQTFTVGGSYGFGRSKGDATSTLVDIDGDNLPDKLFRADGVLKFRRNTFGEGTAGFAQDAITIEGLPGSQFSQTRGRSTNYGYEVHAGPAFFGRSKSRSTTRTVTYLMDRNGDGLMDVSNNGVVHFNYRNAQGHPEFTPLTDSTENPLLPGGDILLQPIDTAEINAIIAESPLLDVVRTWVAPYAGFVRVEAAIELVNNATIDSTDYQHEDGIRATVQLGGTELCSIVIDSGDFDPHSFCPALSAPVHVDKGDQFYFRLQSKWDGAFDLVSWAPTIEYETIDDLDPSDQPNVTNANLHIDANGKNVFKYDPSTDFLLANDQGIEFTDSATVMVDGSFSKLATSDSVWLEIIRYDSNNMVIDVIPGGVFSPTDTVTAQEVAFDTIIVLEGDYLIFRMRSTTNIEWNEIQWSPRLYYTAFVGYTQSQLLDTLGQPLFQFFPVVTVTAFNEPRGTSTSSLDDQPLRPYIPDSIGWITMGLDVTYADTLFAAGEVTFSVKKKHELIAKRTTVVPPSTLGGFDIGDITFYATPADTFFIEVHIPERRVSNALYLNLEIQPTDTIPNYSEIEARYGIFTVIDSSMLHFGPLHRRWGQFTYNYTKNEDLITDPIDVDALALTTTSDVTGINFNEPDEELDELENETFENPLLHVFDYMYADRARNAWVGPDIDTYVKGDTMSSSRLGEDDVTFTYDIGSTDGFFTAPVKVSKDTTKSRSYGLNIIMGLGYNDSEGQGTSRIEIDAMDLDGDRIPEVIREDSIQGTVPTGGYENQLRSLVGGSHVSSSSSSGWAVGGSFAKPNFSNSASPSNGLVESIAFISGNPIKSLFKCDKAQEASGTNVGVNLSFNTDPTIGEDRAVVSWTDVNGDGLPDKVYDNGVVSLNVGRSFLPQEDWGYNQIRTGSSKDWGYGGGGSLQISDMSFAAGVSATRTENGAVKAFTDVNGDGLVDILYASGNDSQEWLCDTVRLNTGNGFSTSLPWPMPILSRFDRSHSVGESANGSFSYGFNIFPPPIKFVFNVNGAKGHGFSRTETQFSDINGDGFPDFLRSQADNELHVLSSRIRRTNLLKEVRSPFGAKWCVDYEVAGNTYDLPQSKWVMRSLTAWDGFTGDGPDTTYTTFAYAQGQYDRRERETYGFGEVRTHEWDTETMSSEPYRTTIQTYDVSGYYTKGLPLEKTVQDGQGNKFIETVNTYQLKLLNGSDAPPNYNSDNDDGAGFPALVRTTERFFEGEPQANIYKTVRFAYDSIGNVTQYVDSGFVGQDDVVRANITYHDLDDLYIKSTPEKITVSVDGTVRRERTQEIDQTNGNITAIHQIIDDDEAAHYDLDYYDNGNLKWIKRPANHKDQRMQYDYTYDPEVETYVTEVHDAYGQRSTSTYEYRFGQLTGTKDMNGQETRYAIDDRGRVTSVIGPYEIASGQAYTIKLEYFPDAVVPYSVVTHFDPEHPSGEGIRTVTFLDGLFRPLQVKKSAVIRDGNGNEEEKWIVSGRVSFDAFGRTGESLYPTESAAAIGSFVEEPDTVAPTKTTFDILDRELTVTLPDGSSTSTAYGVGSTETNITALHKRVTDALGNKKDSYTDVREREIARTDFGPEGAIWTTFRYNGIGELLDVTDHGGNITSYTYDQLGRKLTYDHPDGGLTEFTYDPAGNLLTKNTANLREMFPDGGPIKYSYHYQRVDTINYPRNFMNQVVHIYGDSTEAEYNRVGRVKVQLDGSGGQEFFYGPLGEVEKTIRTIVVSTTDIRTFVSEERYDTWNRIQVMKYPDGDSVDYAYNTAGKLKHLTSTKDNFGYDVVKDIGYDKFEQRVYLKHGNDVETRYTYEPDRRRLSTLRVDQPNGTRIMDNVYSYDLVNNVLSLVNNRSVPSDGQGGPMVSHYQYDNLYRLTDATGTYTGSAREDAYALHMVYNNLHNIRQKTQTHTSSFPTAMLSNYDFVYAYEGDRPHTPSKVGYRTYDYDASGNLNDWDEDAPRMGTRHMAWDEENRLQAVNDAGYVSQFTYDAGGERVLKSHGPMQGVYINGAPVGLINHRDNYTIYVSPYLVQTEHGFTKHYFIEGQRVTSRTGNGHFLTGPMPTNGITAGRVNYASRFLAMQQAGQQQVVNNANVPGPPTLGGYNGQPEISGNPTYLNNIGTYAAPDPSEGWPMPPVPPGAPGTPPTMTVPSVTNETVTAGYAFITDANQAEMNRYFFHPDHLGSASYITGTDGTARQHLEYMAFGETFVEEYNATGLSDYLFNGKEQDRITGLYYYGARYYDPVASMWASVDPMAEKFVSWSPYNYTLQNPVVLNDPDGKLPQMVVGALIGGGMDLAIQTIQVYRGKQEQIKWGSVAASTATGALGVGLAAKAKYFLRPDVAKAATMAIDASMEAMKQVVTKEPGKEINWKEVGMSAVMGATVGHSVDNAASGAAKDIMFDTAKKQAIESDASALGSIASGIGSAVLSPLLQTPTENDATPSPNTPSPKYGSYGTGGRSDMRVSHELNE